MKASCDKCDAKCCRYFCFEIDKPDDYDEFEDIRWYLCHEGVTVHIDNGDWYISIDNRCLMLDAAGYCRIYDDRPLICRKYSQAKCDLTSGHYGYDEEFHTPEEIDAYARKTLGKKLYEQQKKKQRAKFEKKAKK